MVNYEVEAEPASEVSAEAVREQLELLVTHPSFRTSKRSVEFLRFVVEKTLDGEQDQIKERTIGIEVFGRAVSYDTASDHVVRTAAIELRKRLATYYDDEAHRSELRMSLVPGSYVPKFTMPHPVVSAPAAAPVVVPEPVVVVEEPVVAEAAAGPRWGWIGLIAAAVLLLVGLAVWSKTRNFSGQNAQVAFWAPVLDTPGNVLIAVGNVPNGPPGAPANDQATGLPILRKTSQSVVPFADTVTIARVTGELQAHGKKVVIRRETTSTFSELREGPVVLIGAFNNEWSLRLTRDLRYTLAIDGAQHLIYIKDAKDPAGRKWSWSTDKPVDHQGSAGSPQLEDFALISRIWNSETGRVVVVIGGLYTYGTEAAGEFLTDPELLRSALKAVPLDDRHKNVQIVLGTTVTDETAGPPRVLAISAE